MIENQHLKSIINWILYMILIITNHSFYKYGDIKKIDNLSLELNYSFLANFLNDLDKFIKLKPQKEETKEKIQMCMMKFQNYVMA